MKTISVGDYVFRSKKDADFYHYLTAKKERGVISSFSFLLHDDEKDEKWYRKPYGYTVNEQRFSSKADVEFFLLLQERLVQGIISSFSLASSGADAGKYKAKKVSIDNHLFDSREEGKYYLLLKERVRHSDIHSFSLQPRFTLQPSYEKNGKKVHPITYRADFSVTHLDGQKEIIDVKGMKTPDFRLKQKMFDYLFPDLTLTLVKYVEKYGGWVTWEEWEKAKKKEKKTKTS